MGLTIAAITLIGPILGGLGFWWDIGWLFWVGVILSAVNLLLNLASGVMKLPVLPAVAMAICGIFIAPWYVGAGIGLLAWTGLEGLGGLVGKGKGGTERQFSPISGGNGEDVNTPAIINCASMGMANFLIDQFISERHGAEGAAWVRHVEFFVDSESGKFIRCICIKLNGQSDMSYFFDISQPMRNP